MSQPIESGDLIYNTRTKCYGLVLNLFADNLDYWSVEWYDYNGMNRTMVEHESAIKMYKMWLKDVRICGKIEG